MNKRSLWVNFGLVLVFLLIFFATRKSREPSSPQEKPQDVHLEKAAEDEGETGDSALIKSLLRENLSSRTFDFPLVVEAASGKKVLPLENLKSRDRITGAIREVLEDVVRKMNAKDSPILELRRINEGSRYFEDALLEGLDAIDGISCGIPETREGKQQRSGYPDLKITDEATGEIYYLDPKLMEHGSVDSTLRTFYFEPKSGTLKITDDAAHLLIGIEHDGVSGNWKFLGWRLIDLSGLKVRLKAEFQASNRDVYSGTSVEEDIGQDGEENEE